MKKYLLTILALAGIVATVSCKKDKGEDTPETPSVVLSLEASVGSNAVEAVTSYDLQSGQQRAINVKASVAEIGNYALSVTFGGDNNLVATYNAANQTSYTMLPATAYSFEPQSVTLDVYNKTTTASVLTLTAPDVEVETSYIFPLVISNVKGAEFTVDPKADKYYFVLNVKPEDKTGAGTKENPYRLRTTEDLLAIESKMVEGNVTYFRMENDIDMKDVEKWAPINLDEPYALQIYFDGNGKTIKNFTCKEVEQAGFFGVLNGTVENVTFDNAFIEPTGRKKASGILAAYLAKGNDIKATVKKVTIKNSTHSTTVDTSHERGGIVAGESSDALVEQVYIENCNITGDHRIRYVGFIGGLGADGSDKPTVIRNCYVKGGTIYGDQQVAGIYGRSMAGITIENCGVSCDVDANFNFAGILAYPSSTVQETVTGCLVWSNFLKGTGTNARTSATIAGVAEKGRGPFTFKNNVYKAGIEFSSATDGNVLGETDNWENKTVDGNTPYFGKASSAKTASEAAKALGWDETIWDLSGAEPVLK